MILMMYIISASSLLWGHKKNKNNDNIAVTVFVDISIEFDKNKIRSNMKDDERSRLV